jgi:heptosyltransferase-2
MNAPIAPPPIQRARRLAVVSPNWVGDTVMATPVFRALRAALPEAHIAAFARPGIEVLLRGAPWFDALHSLDMHGPTGPWRAARILRNPAPEAILLLPNSFRSALTARVAAIPLRIGYARDGRTFLLTHPLPVAHTAEPTPTIEYYARLGAFTIGAETIDAHPQLFVTAQEDRDAAQLLSDVDDPLVLLIPGASKPAKRWPADRYAAVADALANRRDVRIAVTGAPSERDVLDAVITAARTPIIDLAARGIDLGTLKAVIHRAALLITNDTGPRHIAVALDTPVVTLFGPTDHRWTTLPDARERKLLAEPFLPESLVADRHPKACIITRIPVEDVVAAAEALLDAPPISADAAR